MKYGKNDIEWQTSIEGMSLSDLGDYLRKREGSFNVTNQNTMTFFKVRTLMLLVAKFDGRRLYGC